jgi:hypothetical protein
MMRKVGMHHCLTVSNEAESIRLSASIAIQNTDARILAKHCSVAWRLVLTMVTPLWRYAL